MDRAMGTPSVSAMIVGISHSVIEGGNSKPDGKGGGGVETSGIALRLPLSRLREKNRGENGKGAGHRPEPPKKPREKPSKGADR